MTNLYFTSYDYDKNIRNTTNNDFRIWKQKQNLANENIMGKAVRSQAQIKNFAEVLNEEQKHDKWKKYGYSYSTDKNKNRELINPLSDNVQKIMKEVGKIVTEMKTSEEILSKKNITSLLKTKEQMKKSETLSEPNALVKTKEKEYQASLEGRSKKTPNYKFLSDSYRKQLNKIFLNFNPIIHLGNVHMLRKLDPTIDQEFQIMSQNIDKELSNITSPKFYSKQYEKFRKQLTETNEEVDNLQKLSLPKLANKTAIGFNNTKYSSQTKYTNHTDRSRTKYGGEWIDMKKVKKDNSKNKNESNDKKNIKNASKTKYDGFGDFHKINNEVSKTKYGGFSDFKKGGRKSHIKSGSLFSFNNKKKRKNQKEHNKKYFLSENNLEEMDLMSAFLENVGNSINDRNMEFFFNNYKGFKGKINNLEKVERMYFNDINNAEKNLAKMQEINLAKNLNNDIENTKTGATDDNKEMVKKMTNYRDTLLNDISEKEKKEESLILKEKEKDKEKEMEFKLSL